MFSSFEWGNKTPMTLQEFQGIVSEPKSDANQVSVGALSQQDRLKNVVNAWKKLSAQDQTKIAREFCSSEGEGAKKSSEIEEGPQNENSLGGVVPMVSKDSVQNNKGSLELSQEAQIVGGLVKLGVTASSNDTVSGVVPVQSKTGLFSRIKTLLPWHKKSEGELQAELKSLIEAKRSVAQVSGSESGILGRIASVFQFVFSRGSRPEDNAKSFDPEALSRGSGAPINAEVDGDLEVSEGWKQSVDSFLDRSSENNFSQGFDSTFRDLTEEQKKYVSGRITELLSSNDVTKIAKKNLELVKNKMDSTDV